MNAMKYATFAQRFSAMLIDAFLFMPISLLILIFAPTSKTLENGDTVLMSVSFLAYTLYGHSRYGQTIGKYAMGIRVVRTSGERIGCCQA